MDNTLESIVKRKIEDLKDVHFQEFVNKLYSVYYSNFVVVKQKHDKGADGIINNNTVIACYAPEKHILNNFKKKINCEKIDSRGDFQKYRDNWQTDYPNWQIVYNGEWTAEMIQFVQNLKKETELVGLPRILQMFQELTWTKRKQLFDYLNIDDKYHANDIISEIVDDIIKENENLKGERVKYESPILEKKISVNYSQEDLDLAQIEVVSFYQNAHIISEIIGENTDKQTILLTRVIKDYNATNQDFIFKERKKLLIEKYAKDKIIDDYYCHYINNLLLYVFEKCLIGKKP